MEGRKAASDIRTAKMMMVVEVRGGTALVEWLVGWLVDGRVLQTLLDGAAAGAYTK